MGLMKQLMFEECDAEDTVAELQAKLAYYEHLEEVGQGAVQALEGEKDVQDVPTLRAQLARAEQALAETRAMKAKYNQMLQALAHQ